MFVGFLVVLDNHGVIQESFLHLWHFYVLMNVEATAGRVAVRIIQRIKERLLVVFRYEQLPFSVRGHPIVHSLRELTGVFLCFDFQPFGSIEGDDASEIGS